MPTLNPKNNDLLQVIINGIKDIQGNNIISLNFSDLDNSICEYFVICSGTSNTHVKAIHENVRKIVMKNIKQKPWHVESDNTSEWILMDYSDIILHIFQEKTRDFYNIEELWGDAKKISHN